MEEQLESWHILAQHLGTSWHILVLKYLFTCFTCSILFTSPKFTSQRISHHRTTSVHSRFLHKQQLEMGGLLKRLKLGAQRKKPAPLRVAMRVAMVAMRCDDVTCRASREELKRSRKMEMERLLQRAETEMVKECQRMSKNMKELGKLCFFFHEMDEIVEIFSDIGCCKTEFIGRFS